MSCWEPDDFEVYNQNEADEYSRELSPEHRASKWCECDACMAAADEEHDRRRDDRIMREFD